jgi:hypothetical protein
MMRASAICAGGLVSGSSPSRRPARWTSSSSPSPATPRRDPKRRSRLLAEHKRRVGDPQIGGGRGKPIMTAYRQDCILCATSLLSGPQSPKQLKTLVARAPTILQSNVYGWFAGRAEGSTG